MFLGGGGGQDINAKETERLKKIEVARVWNTSFSVTIGALVSLPRNLKAHINRNQTKA